MTPARGELWRQSRVEASQGMGASRRRSVAAHQASRCDGIPLLTVLLKKVRLDYFFEGEAVLRTWIISGVRTPLGQ